MRGIHDALNELGVPGPGYPAPVANAVEILSDVQDFLETFEANVAAFIVDQTDCHPAHVRIVGAFLGACGTALGDYERADGTALLVRLARKRLEKIG
jgi:hypothetical protein